MKAAYLGGTRGHQAAVYRPGTGWSGSGEGSGEGRRFRRQPRAFKNDGRLQVYPVAMAYRRRPGLRTKTIIVTSVIAVAAVLTMVLSGGAQF
jgi:hypothetical protein